MSGISRAVGFFLVSFVPIAQDQLRDHDSGQALLGAIALAGLCTLAFAAGGLVSSAISGRPGRTSVVELVLGGLAAMATWSFLFRVWLDMEPEVAAKLGALGLVSHLAVIFAIGAATVLVTSRRAGSA